MSSRAEEKERRRREREAQEAAAKQAAARRRAIQIAGAAVGVAVIAVVVVLLVSGGGSNESEADVGKLTADARAAGCTFRQFKSEGRTHTTGKVRYKTNPPTSGNHNPVPAQDGIYAPGNEPNKENWVHSLEHGRILFQYRPGTPAAQVARLRALAEEELEGTAGYHTLLFQNNTNMPAKFAAVAWTRYVTCNQLGDPQIAVMREFRKAYTDKAPEFIP